MSFQVHLVDRLLFEDNMDSEFRAQVMNSLGKQSARIMQENCEDLFGPGDYKKGYINTLNLRSMNTLNLNFQEMAAIILYTDTCQKNVKMSWATVRQINGLWIKL